MNLLPALALATLVASDDVCSARLDHLLAVYRDYGLPFPPSDAKLYRRTGRDDAYLEIDQWTKKRFRIRTITDMADLKSRGWSVEVVKPDPAFLAGTKPPDLEFVIHCHARGWKSLSCAAFRKWLAKAEQSAERQIACEAWDYWLGQIRETETPFADIAKYMKRALPRTGESDEQRVAMVRALELAAIPSKAAPGSEDALIDELIEETVHFSYSEAYRKLARRGFDAIPALIAHIGDNRLTRCESSYLGQRPVDFYRVKDAVYRLLCEFSDYSIKTPENDDGARTAAAGKWFADVQKIGEEKYVVTRAGMRNTPPEGDPLFAVLVAKYPKRLPEAYRNFMDNKRTTEGNYAGLPFDDPFARAIVESTIPEEEKIKVLEYAATRDNAIHQVAGIHHLIRLGARRGTELLIAALDKLESYPSGWVPVQFAWMAYSSTDPAVLRALIRAAARVDTGVRLELISAATDWRGPKLPSQRFALAFLASLLNDTSVWEPLNKRQLLGGHPSSYEVRNHAAAVLARLLGIKDETPRDSNAAQWTTFREQVYHAYEHVLRR